MQTRNKNAAVNKLTVATPNHDTVNSSNHFSRVWHLSDHTPASIYKALDESNMLLAEDLVDEMYETFKCAMTYMSNAQESGNIDTNTIANDMFSNFFKPFSIYYHLLKISKNK